VKRVIVGGEGNGGGRGTHDFNIVLSEIPAFVDSSMLAFSYRGSTKVMVKYETSGMLIAGSSLMNGVRDAHI
jgi:enoyl-[acyl-carrier-protein] reductase (NADH)